MGRRRQTFIQDMQMLFNQLTHARHPPGLLLVKLREIKQFTPAPARSNDMCGDFQRGDIDMLRGNMWRGKQGEDRHDRVPCSSQAAVRPSDQPPPDPAVMQGAIRDPLVLTGREALEVIVDRLDS
eukprot:g10994.t1